MKNPRYFTLKKLLLVFAGSLFLLACRTIQPVSVTEIEDVTLSSVSKKEIEMKFSLKIKNPNSFGFFIYKSSMYVKLDALSLGNAELKQKVFVKGNSEDTYTFEVKSRQAGFL